ncbi:hypothetical protein PQX77_000865 [Marasmius sp. AFHP31]|nr:hypothetical protein PQX77_000865 [Marasmius sp. AFHP31]
MISLPESNAITFLEVVSVSLLYGISLVLFFSTVLELLRAHHANKNMLLIALMFFILSTVAAATNCYGIITAHEKVDELRDEAPPQMPVGPNPVVEWYKYTPLPVLVISYITYTSSAVLADGVLVGLFVLFPCRSSTHSMAGLAMLQGMEQQAYGGGLSVSPLGGSSG